MDLQPSARQQELIARARWLAQERFAPRAAAHDRDASFPFDDYADLRAEGFLGLCVPERHGGLGASYETYCLVAEQLAQGNASTSLTFNMHCLTMLMMGELADAMPMSAAARERHDKLRAAKFREVIEQGVFYGQPHSEPVEQGETDRRLSMGGRRFGTTARKVDGGYVVSGRKFFVSLAGAAPYFATPAIRLGESHRATRIHIEELIPGDGRRRDLREQRLRSLVRKVTHAREESLRADAVAMEARQRLDAALHDLADAIEIEEVLPTLRQTG